MAVTGFEALAFVLQATRLCAGGKTVLEPVAVITRDCSNMWHVLKVQVIPYYMGLRDHGMEDRRMQLLLLEKPECHPVSLSEKDHFMPLFEALSAGPPLTGKALPEVRLAFCHSAALSLGVLHLCAMPEQSQVRPVSFAVHVPLCRGDLYLCARLKHVLHLLVCSWSEVLKAAQNYPLAAVTIYGKVKLMLRLPLFAAEIPRFYTEHKLSRPAGHLHGMHHVV